MGKEYLQWNVKKYMLLCCVVLCCCCIVVKVFARRPNTKLLPITTDYENVVMVSPQALNIAVVTLATCHIWWGKNGHMVLTVTCLVD